MEIREATEQEVQILMQNITWLRKKYGYSKKMMAGILGIGLWSLNKIERGELPPKLSVELLITVWRRFGIYPSVMLTRRLGE